MLYDVNNDRFKYEYVTSLAGVMEVQPNTEKAATPATEEKASSGVNQKASKEKLVLKSVHL